MRPKRNNICYDNLTNLGIPKKFQEQSLNDFCDYDSAELKKLKQFLQKYIDNLEYYYKNNVGLFLHGSNGVGKTMLASIILKNAYIYRYTIRRCTYSEYITEHTKLWSANSLYEKEYLEEYFYQKYKSVDFLVIEEIGKEIDTKLSLPILEDCLRYREDKGLVTIICTNLSISILKEKYGESIISLIQGNTIPIKIESIDRRKEFFGGIT